MHRVLRYTAVCACTAILWISANFALAENTARPETETRVHDISDLIDASGEKARNDIPFARHPVAERLMDLIVNQVGEKEEWAINGGDISYINVVNDKLPVRTSTANHDVIDHLITSKRKALLPSVAFREVLDLTYPGESRSYPIKDKIEPRLWIVHPFHVSDQEEQEGPFTWQEAYEELEHLITGTVGDFRDWIGNGGDESRIDDGPNGILISTSATNQAKVDQALNQFLSRINASARFQVKCLIAKPEVFESLDVDLEYKHLVGSDGRSIGFSYLEADDAIAIYKQVREIPGAATMTVPILDVKLHEKTYIDWGEKESYLAGYKEVPTLGPDGVVVNEFGGTFIQLIGYYEEGLIFAAHVRNIVERSHIQITIRPTLLNVAQPISVAEWWGDVDDETTDPVQVPDVSVLDAVLTLSVPDGAWFVIDLGNTTGPIKKTDRPDPVAESVERKVLLLVHVETVSPEAR